MDVLPLKTSFMSRKPVLVGLLIAVGAALTLFAADGFAGKRGDDEGGGVWGSRRGGDPGVSLDEAVSNLRRGSGGKVLSADTVRREGERVHRIKILTDKGRVKRYQVDGQTGRPVPPEGRR